MKPQDDLQDGWLVTLSQAKYLTVLDLQRRLVRLRYGNIVPDTLLLVEHEPVITLGRRGKMDNILASADELASQAIEIHQVERGGDVTYHGPGQLVGYPVISLAQRNLGVRAFVHLLEETIIETLADSGILAGRHPQHRGVWVGEQKIAALGVAVRRWVSFHGFALNVSPKLEHYCYIYPCGLAPGQVASMQNLLGAAPGMATVTRLLIGKFTQLFPGNWQPLNSEELVRRTSMHEETHQNGLTEDMAYG